MVGLELASIAYAGVFLTLGMVALLRAKQSDIPVVVSALASWFRRGGSVDPKVPQRNGYCTSCLAARHERSIPNLRSAITSTGCGHRSRQSQRRSTDSRPDRLILPSSSDETGSLNQAICTRISSQG
jgi:hypothetical protein